jgi:hypothetical protein
MNPRQDQIGSSELLASTEGYCVLRSAAPGGFRSQSGRCQLVGVSPVKTAN